MKVIDKRYGLVFLPLLASLGSCIFIVNDRGRGNISSIDTAAAYGPVDTLRKDTTARPDTLHREPVISSFLKGKDIDTRNVLPAQVVDFAKSLIGIPYRYGSTDPSVGFDCSGFITYVFHHFDIVVPRSSIDFTPVGKEVSSEAAKAGDLILFTGTDSTERFVGHMGLVVSNDNGQLEFIHSTSGKKNGVTITPLSSYYRSRYMKTIRIFPQNN